MRSTNRSGRFWVRGNEKVRSIREDYSMIDMNRSEFPGQYAVSVGHTRVVVDSASPADAIRQARLRLGVELPRLYDVIHSLADSQFTVTPLSVQE